MVKKTKAISTAERRKICASLWGSRESEGYGTYVESAPKYYKEELIKLGISKEDLEITQKTIKAMHSFASEGEAYSEEEF